MSLIILFCIIIAIVLISYISSRRGQQKANKAVLFCLPKLHSMIGQLQKHRGMNASFLQGNTGAKATLDDIQNQVASIIAELSQHKILTEMDRWLSFVDHWSRLGKSCVTLSTDASFQQHTSMIENLLYLLEDLVDTAPFVAKDKDISSDYINLLWRELPLLVECIGQSRAVGMPVATRGKINQIDKIKIGYLRDKIDAIAVNVFSELDAFASTNSTPTPSINVAKSSCSDFVSMLSREFINADIIKISAEQYFDIASNTMNTVNEILKNEVSGFTYAKR